MPGRPMNDYTVIPSELHSKRDKMQKLLQEAAQWCRTLPPKAAKKAARAKPPSTGVSRAAPAKKKSN